ncbi:MAG: CHASE2 domain-containing protein, partial [Spirochaetes bacterium]|nr:CHASE2 domain-containing protein [Spirochaetota bacterium]
TLSNTKEFVDIILPLITYMNNIADIGFVNTKNDYDNVIRKYPLAAKYKNRYEKKFIDLREGDYADVLFLVNYKIQLNNDTGKYGLQKYESKIFKQNFRPLHNRKHFNKIDIDLMKAIIEKHENDFQLELEIFKGRLGKQNKEIISKVKAYTKKSNMPEDMKMEIIDVINEKDNLKDIDEILNNLTNTFKRFAEKNKKWAKEYHFFNKLYNKCIKVNKVPEVNQTNRKKFCLYDLLYKNKKIHFEELFLMKESFIMSIPLVLISRYYHVDIDDIEVIFGKEILLKNPKIYNSNTDNLEKLIINNKECNVIKIPIDKHGCFIINYTGKTSNPVISAKTTFDMYNYSDLISGKKMLVENKIAMIGAFAKGITENQYQTPIGTMSEVEIIANTINTVIMGNFIRILPKYLYLIILLLISIAIAIIASNKKILMAYVYTILFIFVYYIFATILFISSNIVLEVPKVIIITIFSFTSVIVYRLFTEQGQKKII